MTTKRWIFAIVAMLLAFYAHYAYHYAQRPRPARPWAESQVAGLLANTHFAAAVWVPYPHQNLPRLRDVAGVGSRSTRAVARLAGLPAPALPTFGPLTLPPSSEIAVAADETGERFVVLAQVYPAFATFARLAGGLANNPWLSGGEIVVEGQTAEVSWRGNQWQVISSGLSAEVLETVYESTETTVGVGLGWIRIWQAVDPLPSGLYRLWEDDDDLRISSQSTASESPVAALEAYRLADRLTDLNLFLLAFTGGNEAVGDPAQALAFFDQEEGKTRELPRIAAVHQPGGERWSLPGESLLELAGREPRTAVEGGWSITALDSTSLEEARHLAPDLEGLKRSPYAWGLWLHFGGGLAEVNRIAKLLADVPIAPRRQVERWNDAKLVLTPLAERFKHLEIVVTEEPRTFELRLAGQSGGSGESRE